MTGKFQDYIKTTIDNRGKNPSQYYEMEKYPVIDNVLIKNTLYPDLTAVTRYIDQTTFDNFLRGYVHKNMPLITLVGNGIGNVTLAPSSDVAIVQNTIGFEVTDDLDEVFLFYWLRNNQERIKNFNRGSGQPSIKKTDILAMDVDFPQIQYQKKIANILMGIDNKIECNNAINRNLSELLTTMYRHDYLEEIPNHKDWIEVTMDDITSKFATGLNPRKNFVLGHGENYYVTIKSMNNNRVYLDSKCDMVDNEALVKINKRSDLRVGDLLFSGIGTIGRVHLIDEPPINWNISESVFTMRPSKTVSSEFLYLLLLSYEMQDYAVSLASGSVQKGIRMADLKRFKLHLPSKEDMDRMTSAWKPLIDQIKKHEKESDELAKLRDILLPKLMSGELDVSELDI